MRHLVFACLCGLLFSACTKTEGEGGAAKVRGKVYIVGYKDDYATTLDTALACDEDVYITYGGNTVIDDKATTNDAGEYGFDYLRPGDYTITTYTYDSIHGNFKMPLVYNINIKGKKDTYTLPDIYIYKEFKERKTLKGTAFIYGKVYVKDYNAAMEPKSPVDEYYGGGEDVYLKKIGEPTIIDKVETNYDGEFVFEKVLAGNYEVYVYSKDTVPMAGSSKIEFSTIPLPSKVNCTVLSNSDTVKVSDIIMIK